MTVSKSTNSETLNRTYGDFLRGQLMSRNETAFLVDSWMQEQRALDDLIALRKIAFSDYQVTKGPENWAELALSLEIRQFHQSLLTFVEGSKESKVFRSFFPSGLKPFGTMSQKSLKILGEVVELLESAPEEVVELAKSLIDAYKNYQEMLNKRQEAYQTYRKAYRVELQGREKWVEAYRQVRRELDLLFKGNRAMVKAFFWKETKAKAKSEEQPSNAKVE